MKNRKKPNVVDRVLYSSNKPRKVVLKFFKDLSSAEIFHFSKRISQHRFFYDLPLIKKKPDVSDFYVGIVPDTSLEKSISFMLGQIICRSQELDFFLDKQEILTKQILMSRYDDAHKTLDEINLLFGLSIWYVTLKGSLFDLQSDNEAKKEFQEKYLSIDNLYLKYILRHSMSKLDSSGIFIQNINAFRNGLLGLNSNISDHLLFRLTPLDFLKSYNFEYIINEEKNTNIIDCYKSLERLLTYNVDSLFLDDGILKRIIETLGSKFHSTFSRKISILRGAPYNFEVDQQSYKILDLYTDGHYEKICELVNENTHLIFEQSVFELYVKSLAKTNSVSDSDSPVVNELANKIKSIYLKDDDYLKNLNNFQSVSFAFSELPWFDRLNYLILQEEKYTKNYHKNSLFYNLTSTLNTPFKADYIPNNIRDKYLSDIQPQVINSSTLEVYRLYHSGDESENSLKDKVREKKYKAISLIKNDKFKEAEELLNSEFDALDELSKLEYSSILMDCFIKSGCITKAINYCANSVLINRYTISLYDINLLCEFIKNKINDLSGIEVPVLLSLYTRMIDDEFRPILRYSLDNFFIKNKIQSIDQLILEKDDFDESFFNYFLEHVCVNEVMKLSLFFEGTEDMDNNRLKVCNYLLPINNKNDQISDEIKLIAKKQVLNLAVKKVENSKIYADTSRIKSLDNSGLDELYNSYVKLRSKNISIQPEELASESAYQWLKKDYGYLNKAKIAYLYKKTPSLNNLYINEKNDVFMKLIYRIRDEFVFGVNGLNSNLSTRIRHGHFPSTLRKALLDEKLITSRFKDSIDFKPNDYWIDSLKPQDKNEVLSIDTILRKFSSDFESLITEVNDKWFQIKIITSEISEKVDKDPAYKQHALFDFTLSQLELYCLQKILLSETSYSDFMRVITDWLWQITDINLMIIKSKIEYDLNERVYNLIKDMQSDIHQVMNNETKLHDFNNAIGRSKEAMKVNIELISSWFNRLEVNDVDSFEFDTVVEIARRAADANVKYKCLLNNKFKGDKLTFFVDVLYMLFENAISKSELKKEDVIISLTLTENNDDSHTLAITNNCKEILNLEEENNKLITQIERYNLYQKHLDFLQGEGRSGLVKIAKILKKDLALNNEMKLAYQDGTQFKIEFIFKNLKRVMLNENIDC